MPRSWKKTSTLEGCDCAAFLRERMGCQQKLDLDLKLENLEKAKDAWSFYDCGDVGVALGRGGISTSTILQRTVHSVESTVTLFDYPLVRQKLATLAGI